MAARSETPKPSCQATNRDSCDRTAAQEQKRIPAQRTASTEPISKRGIKLTPKIIIGSASYIVREVCSVRERERERERDTEIERERRK